VRRRPADRAISLHDELELFVQAGLSPMEALQTATLNPARFLGREKDLGTIEKGKIADLVLLEASPLESIGNSRKIDAVVVNGKLFPKAELQKMLADVEVLAAAAR
jgi:imidazolonepropionase-like amidohydrolase